MEKHLGLREGSIILDINKRGYFPKGGGEIWIMLHMLGKREKNVIKRQCKKKVKKEVKMERKVKEKKGYTRFFSSFLLAPAPPPFPSCPM